MTDGKGRDDVPVWTCDVAALLFDCDGVLVDSDASVLSAWTRWALHYDLDPDVVYPQVHGRRSADTVAALLPEAVAGEGTELIDRFELADAATVRAIPGAAELTAAASARALGDRHVRHPGPGEHPAGRGRHCSPAGPADRR